MNSLKIHFDSTKNRLDEIHFGIIWISFFVFGLSVILVGKGLIPLSAKSSSKMERMILDADPLTSSSLRLEIYPEENYLFIKINEESLERIPIDKFAKEDIEKISKQLEHHVSREDLNTSVSGVLNSHELVASIAMDARLTYEHLHPILIALAKNGITKFGLESQSNSSHAQGGH